MKLASQLIAQRHGHVDQLKLACFVCHLTCEYHVCNDAVHELEKLDLHFSKRKIWRIDHIPPVQYRSYDAAAAHAHVTIALQL
jgi:hypothetical protein